MAAPARCAPPPVGDSARGGAPRRTPRRRARAAARCSAAGTISVGLLAAARASPGKEAHARHAGGARCAQAAELEALSLAASERRRPLCGGGLTSRLNKQRKLLARIDSDDLRIAVGMCGGEGIADGAMVVCGGLCAPRRRSRCKGLTRAVCYICTGASARMVAGNCPKETKVVAQHSATDTGSLCALRAAAAVAVAAAVAAAAAVPGGGPTAASNANLAASVEELRARLKAQARALRDTEATLRRAEAALDGNGGGGSRASDDAAGDGSTSGEPLALSSAALLAMNDRELWPYGWVARSAGDYLGALEGVDKASVSSTPPSAFVLAAKNFRREFKALIKYARGEEGAARNGDVRGDVMDADGVEGPVALREQLAVLALSNDAVWARERSRKEVKAPWVTKAPYFLLCLMLDTIFDGRPIARFWFLETVARMPYFSYLSCFHLFESLGE